MGRLRLAMGEKILLIIVVVALIGIGIEGLVGTGRRAPEVTSAPTVEPRHGLLHRLYLPIISCC